MPNKWVTFVKAWAADHNESYGCSITKPQCKQEYHEAHPKPQPKSRSIKLPPMPQQPLPPPPLKRKKIKTIIKAETFSL